jgi:protocatechuate 3,4-dioxygenase beta subunit
MCRWLRLVLLLMLIGLLSLLPPVCAKSGIPPWDALPALDVRHVQGPYAGRSVCPMCRHGYDAGLLVFLPTTLPPAQARAIAARMQAVAARIDDPRFRPFLVLTGAPPSAPLLQAVRGDAQRWYVATLADAQLEEASRAMHTPLRGLTLGFVFAQRRALWTFAPLGDDWQARLPAFADYAMTFLRANHPRGVVDGTPDTPQGRLWTAPAQLHRAVAFADATEGSTTRVCLVDSEGAARAGALVALRHEALPSPPVRWARSDDRGCLALRGAGTRGRVHAEVYSVLQPVARSSIVASALRPGAELRLQPMPDEAVAATADVRGDEAIVGGPCEGCEAVFVGLPARIPASTRLVDAAEPGEALRLHGVVRDARGRPQPGIVVYAYHTDARGRYPRATTLPGNAARHGRLRGWARSDAAGRYEFLTIRPGAYPQRDEPQHVHLHVIEPGRCTYWIGDVVFSDDPRLDAEHRAAANAARGGRGLVTPTRIDAGWRITPTRNDAGWRVAPTRDVGGWVAERDIVLRANVPDTAGCSASGPRPALLRSDVFGTLQRVDVVAERH